MSDINSTDIQQALESAIDVGKLGDVFKKLVNAIEDQQAQIKSLTSQLNNDKRTKQLENKIADLDAKFEDLHKNLIGDGSQIEKGNLIEISPYKAFAESIQMVSGKRPSIGGTLANTKSADFANDKRYRESYPSRSSITLKSTKAALLEETTPRRNKSFESVNVLPTISRDFAEDKTEILSETQDTRQVLAKEASFNLAENSEHGPNSDPIATENTAPKHFQDTPYADSAPNVVKATREEDGVTNTNSVADAEDIPREHDADRSEGISDVPGSEAASVGSPKNTDNTAAAVPSELVESALSRIDADASVSPSNKLVDEPTSAKSEKTSAAELGDNGENVELTEEGRKEETIAGGDASLPKVSSVDVTRETNDVDTTRLSNIAPSDTVNQRARDSSGNSSKIQSAINTPRSEARDSKTSSARASPLVTDDASKIDSADGKGETLGSVASNKNTPRSRPPSGGSADGLPVADEAVRASADPRTDKARSASVLKIQSVGRSGSKGGVKFSSDTQDPAAIAAAANRVSKSLGTRQSKSSFSITPEEQNRRSSIALQDNDEDEDEDGDFMPPMKRNNSFSVDLNMFQPITEPGIYDPEENVEVPKFSRVPSKSRELVGDHGEQQVETQQQHVTDPPKGRILKGRPSRISTFSRSNSLQRNARARSMRQISYSTDQENNAPAYKTEDRYRMDARNFPLTDVQRKRICRELQLRGRFFLINKKNLEDVKTRHSAQSLKQKVDLLELQVQDLKKKLDTTKNVVRRNYLEFKYAIPPQFSDTLESIMDLLESIEDAGGLASLIQRIQLSTPRSLPTNLLHFNKDGEIPDKIIDAIAAKLQAHTGMPSKAEVNGLQDKIQRIENNAVTFKDLEDMYRPPEEHKTIINNHITNINNYGDSRRNSEAVPYTQSTIESSPNSTDQQAVDTSDSESQAVPRRRKSLISENYARLLKIIAVTADQQIKKAEKEKADDKAKKGAINTESKDLDTIVEEIKKYTDDKVRNANLQLKMGFDALQYKVDSKAAKAELDFIVLQDKLKEQVKAIKDHWEKSRDTANKRDSELLRELEMKVANMSFDKLIYELNRLQREVEHKPSESKVNEMIEMIEKTFADHLGENVSGMQSAVNQVYKAIQFKVNRDDINKLIAAKLAQMQFEEMMAREKELDRYRMATSTKCLSCGQNRPEPPHHRSITGSPTRDIVRTQPPIRRGKTPEGIPLMLNDEKSVSIPKPIDDELSNDGSPRYMHIAGVPQVSVELEKGSTLDQDTWLAREIVQPDPTRLGMSDELHSLLTGNTGLKSLLPQHAPLLPVKDPYGERRKSIEKSPDPLYRKAKIQAHIKEMVKIAAPVASKNFRTSASTPTLPPTVAASLNAKYLLDNGDFNGFSYVEDNVKFTNSSITSNSRAPLGRGALKSAGPGRSVLSASAERMIRPSSSKSRINPSSLRSGSDHSIHHVASNSLGYHSKSRDADHMNSRGLHSPPLLEDSVISQDSQSIVPILPALTQNGVLCTGDERAPEGINGYNE